MCCPWRDRRGPADHAYGSIFVAGGALLRAQQSCSRAADIGPPDLGASSERLARAARHCASSKSDGHRRDERGSSLHLVNAGHTVVLCIAGHFGGLRNVDRYPQRIIRFAII